MLDIKIKSTHDNFKYPIRGSKYAACWDVYAADIKTYVEDKDRRIVEVNLGFATEFTPEYKGIIIPRSNLSDKHWAILNSPCHIDADYRGDWKIKFTPIPYIGENEDGDTIIGTTNFPYQVGDRVAQVYFEKVEPFEWDLVSILSDTDRGSGGFGSTGK